METVTVRIKGGLGNQLFQFSYGYSLSCENKAKLILDTSYFDKDSRHGGYMLDQLMLPQSITIKKISFSTKALLKMNEKSHNQINNIFNLGYIVEGYECLQMNQSSLMVDGYWQDELYFKSAQNRIKKIIRPLAKLPISSVELMEKINNNNSVSIHVRRGDYVKDKSAAEIHGVLGLDYYKSAIEYIQSKMIDTLFFIFSDDPEWAKEHFCFLEDFVVVEAEGVSPVVDLFLMSHCKHNIIANSTFSWWGAWLNQNDDKIVIAPEKWYVDETMNNQQKIVPENWLKL